MYENFFLIIPQVPEVFPRIFLSFCDKLKPGHMVAWWLVLLTTHSPGQGCGLCSWVRHFTLIVPLSTLGPVVQSKIKLNQD